MTISFTGFYVNHATGAGPLNAGTSAEGSV